ncbi:MAG: hypothetical protein ACTSRP_21230 [Candidatus Helarchaeota archaeon]
MLPRKSDRLERAVTNWINNVKSIERIFQKKSEIVIDYVKRIIDLNDKKDEKIFLMNGLEDAIYVLENETFEKLHFILEDILGNELVENQEINKTIKYLKQFRNFLNDIVISTRNFLKVYNLNSNNLELLSNLSNNLEKKMSKYKKDLSQINESFEKILEFLNEQQKISRQFDII